MNRNDANEDNYLDEEWIELLLTAREMELSIEEIRDFLQKKTI